MNSFKKKTPNIEPEKFLSFFKKKKIHTNADSLIGKEFVLLENTISKKSTIKVNDVIWNCECEEDLPAGTTVIILKIVGNHFIVKEKEKK